MITSFLLQIVFTFLNFLISFLPVGSLPSGIPTAITYIAGVMNTFNWFFPLDTLFAVLAIAVAFEVAIIVFHFVEWVYHKIRP